ncbi:hypothetical protein B5S32_g547 [[Candida] boidinii]|uniref:Unnamed protein product n=1 Tax=Candida boidinii TaxID=5477 RepID=A0ACB5TG64_CANBO|nr:hypothetical protein B5S29_g353 [[Candida] boidinii]OWB76396.1 hypothetical protein B5S32_g547 [[Candida] boidinii]GME88174.1 unnamed protein product [[Candida] boidinii]
MSSFEIPKTQTVSLFRTNGGLEVIEVDDNYPVPAINDDEILIKNKYSGVNYIESYFRIGLYPATLPYVMGREASGVVVAAGSNVKNFKVGDNIAYMSSGSFSQYTKIVPGVSVFKLPENSTEEDFQNFAAILLQGLTALTFIEEAYKVKKDDFILVHAAAGGVGLLLTQLISQRGAHVIATASSDEKLQLAKNAGAEYLVNSKTDDILAKVLEITNNKGVQASFDSVGKDTYEISLNSLARKGTFVSFGNASGAVPPFPIAKLSSKNLKVCRPVVNNYVATKEEWEHYTTELINLVKSNALKINIYKIYPLKDYKLAASDIESRKTSGKLLLQIPN